LFAIVAISQLWRCEGHSAYESGIDIDIRTTAPNANPNQRIDLCQLNATKTTLPSFHGPHV
jgi:hypothetical protein